MADHEARRLELNLDATKVTLTTSEGEFIAAQATIAVAQTCIVGKGFLRLDARMDV
jgi:hypothetical protein